MDDLNRQLARVRRQQDQLLNLRLLEEIDQETFSAKSTELRDQVAKLTLLIEGQDRGRAEAGEIALKAFDSNVQIYRRKPLRTNGLRPITGPSVESWKSSV